ncbi:MAG TPA: nuclear transport factor 2 family protein [Acidimicrobiales bacterium]|jgi:ketosteroid isomerase-like protein|nr:nuclear transport factor 2 family protein [Acidimicrobiales bacterium]
MDNEDLIIELFAAIESRDIDRILEIYDPNVEFHWPPPLPYGGSSTGAFPDTEGPTWQSVWLPLQPTADDRAMDLRVISSRGNEVVVVYRQRGRDINGNRYEGEVIGLYEVSNGTLCRAQMFYYDTDALLEFLKQAKASES